MVEASLDKGQGPVATVIIKQGTLRTGQFVAVGKAWGKVGWLPVWPCAGCEAAPPLMRQSLPNSLCMGQVVKCAWLGTW